MNDLQNSMTPTIHQPILKQNDGYTLVETLVASAILLGVLIPAALFLGKITMSQYSHDLLVATQLAREEMEKTLIAASYQDEEKLMDFGKRRWRLTRAIENQSGLLVIRIKVFKPNSVNPLVEFKTIRVQP